VFTPDLPHELRPALRFFWKVLDHELHETLVCSLVQARKLITQLVGDEPKPKKHQELTKALNLPQQVVPIPDQIAALRGEVADLTELMIRVAKGVGIVREAIAAQAPPPPPRPEPVSSRSVKIKEYLSLDKWLSLSVLVRDTGLTPKS
jgi:hypothetical protein